MTATDDDDRSAAATPPPAPRVLRPTVMPAPTPVVRPRSTTAKAPAKAPATTRATASGAGAPSTRTVDAPTTVPGVGRQRIEVRTHDLALLSPGVSAEVCQRAAELLRTFVVQKASERKAVLWGHALQKSYADLVTATLALSQTPLLRRVEGHVTRLLDILASIDVMAMSGNRKRSFGELFRGASERIDTPDALASAQAEIDELVRYLGDALHEVLVLKEQLEAYARQVQRMAVDVEAAALAALFLSQHLQPERADIAQRFTDRSMSLTQTLAQIRAGEATLQLQRQQPLRVVSVVQNVVLVMMPGLLAGIASALVLMERRGMTPTQASELSYQLKQVLQQLQT